MYLGRIVTKSKRLEVIDVVEKTESTDNIDGNIPTLIIGKKVAENLFGKDRVKILDKKIKENVYWTFMKTEKRDEFESDIKAFQEGIMNGITSSLNYSFIPLLTFGYNKAKRMLNFISTDAEKVFYLTDKHVYIYYGSDKVIGFSLKDTEYIGINRDKIKRYIKEASKNNILLENRYFLSREMSRFIGDNEIVVPYLFSVINMAK